MEATLQMQHAQLPRPIHNEFDISDQQGEDLFNQIQLSQQPNPIQESEQAERANSNQVTPKKIKTLKNAKRNMQLDSDQGSDNGIDQVMNSGRDARKEQKMDKKTKKLLKKLKKQKKMKKKQKRRSKNASGLKRLKKQGDADEKSSNKWSGESSQSFEEDSEVSSDSLLDNLNPRKIKSSIKKTERKQGFELKQLGNNPEVGYDEKKDSDDEWERGKDRNNKKAKAEKKEVVKNQDILKSLLQIGLCIDEEEENKEGYEYDNGLEQMQNMKNSKKKGPKIKNKLFLDVDIDEDEEQKEPLPKQIKLEVKPRTNLGCSKITNSFLNKTERLKKVRGVESEIQNQQFSKLMSHKAKQSMVKLISQKHIQEADEIELDVKVPQVIKGNEELNNTLFLKRISSTISSGNQVESKAPAPKVQPPKKQHKSNISRFDFFRSVAEDVKARRSRQITEQVIKNSFKVTKLEEIEEMRKKNEEKRKKEALMGSDQEDEQGEDQQQKKANLQKGDIVRQNNLKFMNFRVEVQADKAGQDPQNRSQKQVEDIEADNRIERAEPEVKKIVIEKIDDKQYKKLIRMQEQGYIGSQSERQSEEEQSQMKNENSNNSNKSDREQQDREEYDELKSRDDGQPQNQINEEQVDENLLKAAEPVELEVDVEVGSLSQSDEQASQQSQENIQDQSKSLRRNQEHEQYLHFLQAEGIEIKKNNKSNRDQLNVERKRLEEKQNDQLVENSEGANSMENDARREFRKLRKLATIIKQKRKAEMKVKKAGEFFDEEAEEGSDNEDHDHEVKNINYDEEEKQYEGLDLDADLQELIDNAVDIDQENEQLAFRKYMEDVKIQDREELKRIMKGDFRRRGENDQIVDEMEQDEKKRNQRMEQIQQYLKEKQQEDGKGLYIQNQNKADSNEEQNQSNLGEKAERKIVQQEIQEVDEMNEQNLKRYLDDKVVQNFRSTTIVRRPIFELPESYKRSKNTVMRNTMKPKERPAEAMKLKKTSSHLNEMIMKNKQKIKPLPFMKGFPLPIKK